MYLEEESTINLIVDLNMDVPNLTRGVATLELVDSLIVGDLSIRPSRSVQILDDSSIDDDPLDSPHSHSSTEKEELWHNDSCDSD